MTKRVVLVQKSGPKLGHGFKVDQTGWKWCTDSEPRWLSVLAGFMAWVAVGLLAIVIFIQLDRWLVR